MSTRKEEQEDSLDAQRSRAMAFAKKRDCTLRLFDEKASAKSIAGRPVLSNLLLEIESLPPRRRPQYIFVTALDRLYRNIVDGMYIGHVLREAKVTIFVAGRGEVQLDTFAKRAQFVGESLGGDAENEGRSKRALASWERRRQSGAPMNNKRPYGLYLERGQDVVDPKTADWVRKAFEWYAAGDGTHVIGNRMRDGAPLQTWLTTRIGTDGMRISKTAKRTNWEANRVAKLLRVKAYRGCIVSPTLFDSVQERLDGKPNYGNERKFEHPLSGAMNCATCGRHLHGRASGATSSKRAANGSIRIYERKRTRYYTCAICHYSVRSDLLERAFFADIGEIIAAPALLKRWIAAPNGHNREGAAMRRELRRLESLNDPKRLLHRRDHLFNLVLSASIPDVDFKFQLEMLERESREISAQCANLRSLLVADETHAKSMKQVTALLKNFHKIYEAATYEDKRELVQLLVQALGGLTVSPDGLCWTAKNESEKSLG